MTEYPLVMIRWLDSRQPSSAWCFISNADEQKAVECATAGWLLKDNEDVKVVCLSLGDLGDPESESLQANGVMTIPTRSVVSIDILDTFAGDKQ